MKEKIEIDSVRRMSFELDDPLYVFSADIIDLHQKKEYKTVTTITVWLP